MSVAPPPPFITTNYNPAAFSTDSTSNDTNPKMNVLNGYCFNARVDRPTIINATFEGTQSGLDFASTSAVTSLSTNVTTLGNDVSALTDEVAAIGGAGIPLGTGSDTDYNGPTDQTVTALSHRNHMCNMNNGSYTLFLPVPAVGDSGFRFKVAAYCPLGVGVGVGGILTLSITGGNNLIRLPNNPGVSLATYVFPHEDYWVDVFVANGAYYVSPAFV